MALTFSTAPGAVIGVSVVLCLVRHVWLCTHPRVVPVCLGCGDGTLQRVWHLLGTQCRRVSLPFPNQMIQVRACPLHQGHADPKWGKTWAELHLQEDRSQSHQLPWDTGGKFD